MILTSLSCYTAFMTRQAPITAMQYSPAMPILFHCTEHAAALNYNANAAAGYSCTAVCSEIRHKTFVMPTHASVGNIWPTRCFSASTWEHRCNLIPQLLFNKG